MAQGESSASSPWWWTPNGNLNKNFSRSETDILFFNYVNYGRNIYNIDKIKSTNNNDNNGMISRKRNDYCFPSWSALVSSQPISNQTGQAIRPSISQSASQPVEYKKHDHQKDHKNNENTSRKLLKIKFYLYSFNFITFHIFISSATGSIVCCPFRLLVGSSRLLPGPPSQLDQLSSTQPDRG